MATGEMMSQVGGVVLARSRSLLLAEGTRRGHAVVVVTINGLMGYNGV